MKTVKKMSQKRQHSGRRRGVAMVELAIVLPIFLLLLVGILELGRVVMINQISTNATREAARRAVVPGATDEMVLGVCNSYLDRGGISSTGRKVQILNAQGVSSSLESIGSHEPITIHARIPLSENTWGFTLLFGKRFFSSSVTMRRE